MHATRQSLLMRVRDPSDRAAWDEFDLLYREWLIRFFCRQSVPFSDAEDLVQRVFSNLVITLPQFTYDPNRGRFRDYLFRCARNSLYEWANCPARNGRALVQDESLDCAAGGDPDPAESKAWEEEWVRHHYRIALRTLRDNASERDIAIFERSLAGATASELAGELEMSEAAVQKVRQRIRDRMEALIATQVAEEDRTDVGELQ